METLRESIVTGLAALDTELPNLTRGEFLTHAIQFGCQIFQVFLRIHPYANGNGHMARYILWIVLARYGFKFQNFPVEPSPWPPDPYVAAIKAHRDGHPEVLEKFVLDRLDPN